MWQILNFHLKPKRDGGSQTKRPLKPATVAATRPPWPFLPCFKCRGNYYRPFM